MVMSNGKSRIINMFFYLSLTYTRHENLIFSISNKKKKKKMICEQIWKVAENDQNQNPIQNGLKINKTIENWAMEKNKQTKNKTKQQQLFFKWKFSCLIHKKPQWLQNDINK